MRESESKRETMKEGERKGGRERKASDRKREREIMKKGER